MAVITISRELGSEGDQIADILCQQLGYTRVDKEMLMHMAEEAGVDVEAVLAKERGFSSRARLISGQMTSLYGRQPTVFDKGADLDDRTYARIVRSTIERYADQGNSIIVGRGGQMVLRDWPKAFHVHLFAPLEVRIRRVQLRFDISHEEARRRITEADEQKRQYIRHMHKNADWKNVKYYHLTINTDHIRPQIAAQAIILVAKHMEEQQSG